jgi:hypothetical protein
VVDPQLATNWLRLGWAQEYRGQQAIADLLSDKPSIEDMDPTIPVLIAVSQPSLFPHVQRDDQKPFPLAISPHSLATFQ